MSLEDLDQAAAFIARDSPRYASALVRRALALASSLTELAERGRIVPELSQPDIREAFVYGYRLLYQITPGTVYILGFIHGARDLSALWEQEDRPGFEDTEA